MVDESNEIMGLLFGEQDEELVTHPAILPVVTVDDCVECMIVILLL